MTENQSEGKLIGDCVISRSNLCSTMDRVHGWRALRITMNQLYYKGPFAIYPLKVFWVGNGLREIRDCGLNHLLRQHTAYEDRARVSRKEKREVSFPPQIFLKLWIFLFLSFLFFFFPWRSKKIRFVPDIILPRRCTNTKMFLRIRVRIHWSKCKLMFFFFIRANII